MDLKLRSNSFNNWYNYVYAVESVSNKYIFIHLYMFYKSMSLNMHMYIFISRPICLLNIFTWHRSYCEPLKNIRPCHSSFKAFQYFLISQKELLSLKWPQDSTRRCTGRHNDLPANPWTTHTCFHLRTFAPVLPTDTEVRPSPFFQIWVNVIIPHYVK